jgi:O-antigen/teichoic acid export membrane protein
LWLVAALPVRRAVFDWSSFRESVAFSRPLYANSLLGFAFQRLDTLLVALLLPAPGVVAVYEIAKRFPLILSRGLGAALVPFLPNMSELVAEGADEKVARFLERTVVLAAFIGYSGALAAVVIQEPLVLLLSSETYLEAAKVIGLLMTGVCLVVQAGIMGQTLIAVGKPVYVTAASAGAAVVSIAANLALIPVFGVVGAGMAALIAALFTNAVHTGFVIREGVRLRLSAYLKPQLAMAMAAAVLWLGGGAMPWRLAALGLFVALSFALRVVTFREIGDLLSSLLSRKRDDHRD